MTGQTPASRRWTPHRKAQLLADIAADRLTCTEACERHGLSVEELRSWQRMDRQYGTPGLRVLQLQRYRGGRRMAVVKT